MLETVGDIWNFRNEGWIVITTNGIVRKDGACVMGRGVALQAKQRFARLPFELGERLRERGNHVHSFPDYGIVSFPVKHHWKEPADPSLIEQSARELFDLSLGVDRKFYLVRPGCGNGQLSWETVRPLLLPWLEGDQFVVVQY